MIENFRELWFFIVTSSLYMYIKLSLHNRIKIDNKVCFSTSFVCLHTCMSFQNYTAMDQQLPYSRIWQPLYVMYLLNSTYLRSHCLRSSLIVHHRVFTWVTGELFLRCGRSVGHRVWVFSCTCPTPPACGAEVCNTNNKISTSFLLTTN